MDKSIEIYPFFIHVYYKSIIIYFKFIILCQDQ